MKTKIIEAAGKTWRVLGEKKEVEISSLPELVKEKEEVVFQALGWLAREDKITYLSRHCEDYVALVPKELEAYRRLQSTKTWEKESCCSKMSLRKLFDLKLF
jgi:hypothetical protein